MGARLNGKVVLATVGTHGIVCAVAEKISAGGTAAEERANLAVFLLSDASKPTAGALIDQEKRVTWANL